MKLVLTRHTETDWNAAKRIQGQSGTGINRRGEEQARRLGESLHRLEIQRIISSDLRRAHETARIIAEILGLTVEYDRRLRECSFGVLEGKTREEIEAIANERWPDDHEPYDFSRFGGERRDDVLRRHLALTGELFLKSPDATVLLLGHGRGLTTFFNIFTPGETIPKGEYRIVELNSHSSFPNLP